MKKIRDFLKNSHFNLTFYNNYILYLFLSSNTDNATKISEFSSAMSTITA